MPLPPRRILYLTYDGLCDPLGQSQILPYMVGLSRQGYAIQIVSFEKIANYKAQGSAIREKCEQSGIAWKPLRYHKYPPVLSTIYDLLRLRIMVSRLQRKVNFEIVHCRSYLTALIGLWMKRRFGTRFIFDMRGFWADERIDGGLWNLKNSLYREIYLFFKTKEIEFLLRSDRVISLTQNARNEIANWWESDTLNISGSAEPQVLARLNRIGGRLSESPIELSGKLADRMRSKIMVIPTCVDEDNFDLPKERDQELEESLGISKKDFVLLYLGSLGTWYLLPEMLDFYRELRRANASAKFLIGTNDNPQEIWKQLRSRLKPGEHDYSEGVIIKNLPYHQIPSLGALVDMGICFIKPSFSKKASSPTKVGEMLALGIPVISNRDYGDIGEVINSECGFLVDGFFAEEYKRIIDSLGNTKFDPATVRLQGLENFSLKKGIEKYNRAYEEVLSAQTNVLK